MAYIIKFLPYKVKMHSASATLYTLQVESTLAVASLVPVLLNARSNTSSLCPSNTFKHFPARTSHNLHVPSIEAVAQTSPVKENCVLDISF